MGHGGPVETSLLRHIRPDLVDEIQFEAAAEDGADLWGDWQSGTNLAYDTAEFSANGVVGDPGESSERVGEELLGAASEKLSVLLTAVENREWPRER